MNYNPKHVKIDQEGEWQGDKQYTKKFKPFKSRKEGQYGSRKLNKLVVNEEKRVNGAIKRREQIIANEYVPEDYTDCPEVQAIELDETLDMVREEATQPYSPLIDAVAQGDVHGDKEKGLAFLKEIGALR